MRRLLIVVTMIAASACTLENQSMPPFSGPSGLALVVNVTATPDVLPQDGSSQSVVQVSATDGAGQPLSGLSFSTEVVFDFTVVKAQTGTSCPAGTFEVGADPDAPALVNCAGVLVPASSTTITTGSDGRAAAVFSAPGYLNAVSQVVATVRVTPLGGSYGSSSFARTAQIRLAVF